MQKAKKVNIKKLSEIEKLRISMDSKFYDVNDQLDEIKGRLVKTDDKLDKVLNHLDSIAGQFKKFDEERLMFTNRQSIHSDQIKELQAAVFPAS